MPAFAGMTLSAIPAQAGIQVTVRRMPSFPRTVACGEPAKTGCSEERLLWQQIAQTM